MEIQKDYRKSYKAGELGISDKTSIRKATLVTIMYGTCTEMSQGGIHYCRNNLIAYLSELHQ